jgi:hypothetical protein
MKFDIGAFFENLSRQIRFLSSLTRLTGALRDDLGTFVIIYRSILHRMRNVSDKNLRKNHNTRVTCFPKIVPFMR